MNLKAVIKRYAERIANQYDTLAKNGCYDTMEAAGKAIFGQCKGEGQSWCNYCKYHVNNNEQLL